MTLTKFLPLFVMVFALATTSVGAKEAQEINQTIAQAYLSYWFSYDSAEATDLTLSALNEDEFGERAELSFTSDDGQLVNGLIGFPKDRGGSTKLALALHPMGIDQYFWWSDKSPIPTKRMTDQLRKQGYTVITIDARQHGKRGREGLGPRELIKRAHSDEPRVYIDTIIGTVRDYRIVLNWANSEFQPSEVLAMGYSMGAQMSLLLASFEPSINTVIAMVPPYVKSDTSPVAPRIHVNRIDNAKVLLLAGSNDPHSNREQTQTTFNNISSKDKEIKWFDSGHRLPPAAIETTLFFIDSLKSGLSNSGGK